MVSGPTRHFCDEDSGDRGQPKTESAQRVRIESPFKGYKVAGIRVFKK